MYNTSVAIKNIRSIKYFSYDLNTPGVGQFLIITWILDLFSWWMLHLKQNDKNIVTHIEIKGIVLIDEIEKYLHHKRQGNILKTLRGIFPKVQFVFTTNSNIIIDNISFPINKI